MTGPEPTERLLEVRRVLSSRAIPIITQRLQISEAALREIAGWAEKDMLATLGAVDPLQVGWVMVSAGAILARNAEDLVAPIADNPDDALASGVMWAGVIAGVAGDALIGEVAQDATPAPTSRIDLPSDQTAELQALGDALVSEMLGVLGSPQASRAFGEDVVNQLEDGLPGLDAGQGGWALRALGVWCAQNSGALAPPSRRRGLRRRRGHDPGRLALGCALAGAMFASAGSAMLDSGSER